MVRCDFNVPQDENGNITDDSYATVTTRLALGLQTNDANGMISIDTSSATGDASSDVFVEGRIESEALGENNKVININSIETNAGDIFVSSLGDIVNSHNVTVANNNVNLVNSGAAIVGHDLVLQAAGDIGSAQKVMTANINGALSAVANGDLYLEQIGTDAFAIRNISATDKIFVQAKNDIYMANDSASDVQGYIYSKNDKAITIISENGSLGEHTVGGTVVPGALRIKNSNSLIKE